VDDLSTWLLEQVAADERAAAEMRYNVGFMSDCGEPHDESIEALKGEWTFDADRLLAECEAKRRIVELHKSVETFAGMSVSDYWPNHATGKTVFVCEVCANHDRETGWDDFDGYPCATLKLLALPYVDRPGYREEWKP
jgi:Family of unknown function (DUF6221)